VNGLTISVLEMMPTDCPSQQPATHHVRNDCGLCLFGEVAANPAPASNGPMLDDPIPTGWRDRLNECGGWAELYRSLDDLMVKLSRILTGKPPAKE
jgi:hypothetical protein